MAGEGARAHGAAATDGLVLRRSGPAEADLLLALQREASVAALAHIFPPERHPFPDADVRDRWRTFAGSVVVGERGGRPVGLAAAEREWLAGLYVVPEAWGSGAAAALHDAAVEVIAAAGHREARLWVLEHNGRARRFYARRGWSLDGTTRVVPFPPHPVDVGLRLALEGACP